MKTAISLPDPIFHQAESVAKRLGVSRSELYAKALTEYLRKYNDEQITAKFNEIYAEENSAIDPVLSQMQFSSLSAEEW
ncbi:MAG: hypothetical protein AAF171_17485 [Cyanobacteria bacterium P01_A01_bin.116]